MIYWDDPQDNLEYDWCGKCQGYYVDLTRRVDGTWSVIIDNNKRIISGLASRHKAKLHVEKFVANTDLKSYIAGTSPFFLALQERQQAMTKLKYLIVEKEGLPQGIIFPDPLTHKQIARVHKAGNLNVVSAGFCYSDTFEAFGKSESLNICSRIEDTKILQQCFMVRKE
jgi:hypothetical protein